MTDSIDLDFGPLNGLIGKWVGDKGLDIAPEPDGKEENPYYETIEYNVVGDVTNAESQTLFVIRYLQSVKRKSNDKEFHNQLGYWIWDPKEKIVMHSLIIPRAVNVLAGGKYSGETDENGNVIITVSASMDNPDWGIIQSPFMRDNACTKQFSQELIIGKDSLSYSQNTVVDIYGKVFDHTDVNTLTPA